MNRYTFAVVVGGRLMAGAASRGPTWQPRDHLGRDFSYRAPVIHPQSVGETWPAVIWKGKGSIR